MVRCRVGLGNELKDRGQFYVSTEERNGPNAEELAHRDVELECSFIISYNAKDSLAIGAWVRWKATVSAKPSNSPMLSISNSILGLRILYQR